MKPTKIYAVILCLAIAVLVLAFVNKNTDKPDIISNSQGFAVVELFTSEGCSSCPPADELLAKIRKESAGKPVYLLAYHVDYWNRLGWKDVFSKAEYSRRQSAYAKWLNLRGVYTPQAVVNGKIEFVGSAQGSLRNAIQAGLLTDAKTHVTLSGVSVNGYSATLRYKTAGVIDDGLLQVALVQNQVQTTVKSGENGGRVLSHVQIVNNFKSIRLGKKPEGTIVMELPANFVPGGYELIVFTQNAKTGEITAATRAPFPGTAMANN
ncbi:DUF1223 domain-containing protein [Mucilaginibacter sp. 14171R-50]|uniref:DUF1223 domain-containing protein n=1 Tax=Mucilaginibacter sp. 14171R-50 TaxID=2703789 RepID=UPI00138B8CAC|nr:DUF1223 domain-containing protein [Mucilaginibacter sp. 14171R-50]QHS54912.1 DUF1223 domain-containing protein [Mucilaginibacter sp. 14171R-50]